MTTETIEKNGLAGYVCPSCRMVFSAPVAIPGNGVACPGCQSLMKIPFPDSKVKEVSVVEISQVDESDESVSHKKRETRRHKSSLSYDEDLDREQIANVNQSDYSLKMMIPVIVISLLALGGIGYIFLKPADVTSKELITPKNTITEESNETKREDEPVKPVYTYDPDDEAKVAEVKNFLEMWFSAESIDDKLKLVSPTEGIKDKMTRYYKQYPSALSEFRSIDSVKNMINKPRYVLFSCSTKDYKRHAGMIEYSRDQILLDWESHVVYNEMTWDELAVKKPTEPVMVRVSTSVGHYYNGEFSDESKWKSVVLSNPNEDNVIYGYVLKNSANDQRIFNFGNTDTQTLILEVHFTPNAESGNQVVISKVIQEGWLRTLDE